MDTIVSNIRKIIDEKGLKHKAVADKAQISPGTLSAMLNGRRKIDHSEIIRLCNVLSVTPNDLYGIGISSNGNEAA